MLFFFWCRWQENWKWSLTPARRPRWSCTWTPMQPLSSSDRKRSKTRRDKLFFSFKDLYFFSSVAHPDLEFFWFQVQNHLVSYLFWIKKCNFLLCRKCSALSHVSKSYEICRSNPPNPKDWGQGPNNIKVPGKILQIFFSYSDLQNLFEPVMLVPFHSSCSSR